MQKSTIKQIAVGALTFSIFALPMLVSAQATNLNLGLNYATAIGLASNDVRDTISKIINAFMGLLGIVAVILILYGGFKWMISRGEEDEVEEAKGIIYQGVIGLIIIISAFAIAKFVVNAVVNATS